MTSSPGLRRWNVLPRQAGAQALAGALGVSPIIGQILLNRGFSDVETARQFLHPSLLMLHDPALIAGMETAAKRIADAIRAGEKIVIYGDYDVDGITATATLWHAITILGGKVDSYIPHRVDEGYGLNSQAIAQICDGGAKLIISVDCGITAIEPVEIACTRGVDVIITDHHDWRPDGVLPKCVVVLHPRFPIGTATYPNPNLCGSGVALKLAWAAGQQFAGGNGKVNAALRELLLNATSLAALATIADVVPLVGENRILAHFGLLGLKRSTLTGVKALLESAGMVGGKVDSYDVGFRLAPRLNACGRMGHAADAVEMLTCASPERALEISAFLDEQNCKRQDTEKLITAEAMEQIERLGLHAEEHRAIVVGGQGWHAGVIGIVASRIVDRYHRPAIVVSLGEDDGHGSGRSIIGFNLANGLASMGDLLLGSGGHEMAAGLTLKVANFEAFRARFVEHALATIAPELLQRELRMECEVTLGSISMGFAEELQKVGPFGPGNPRPILCCRDVELAADANVVGKSGEHLQLRLRQGTHLMKGIAFKLGKMAGELRRGVRVDLAVEPTINEYNGRRSVEVDVKDVRIKE